MTAVTALRGDAPRFARLQIAEICLNAGTQTRVDLEDCNGHHVIPLCIGGSNQPVNLAAVHALCDLKASRSKFW